jgi:YegS/Rv2252/BmrU family lipid kinase
MINKPALLLVNPNSRSGGASLPHVQRLLEEAKVSYLMLPQDCDEKPSEAILRRAPDIGRVIVGGGDGSLNAAAAGLLRTKLPLGVLPLGTGNDFARTIGLPLDLAEAVNIIASGKTSPVDVGMANDYPFFNVASMGFSADLAASLTENAKKRWGKMGYAIAAAKLLADSRLFTATLEHDGRIERFRTFQIAVGNGRFYGGGMTVHADATAIDGLLDFYSLEVDHWWKLLALLPSLRRGTQGGWKDVRSFSTKDLTIRTRKPRAVNLDGELKVKTPVRFTIREQAISVYVP